MSTVAPARGERHVTTVQLAVAAVMAAMAAAGVAAYQLRDGIIPLLDSATYWSGAEALASGHPLTTTLAPSFSNFSVIEFLDRGGRLPFVDFPLGYPTLAGAIGVLIGVREALAVVTVASAGAIGALTVVGAGRPRRVETLWLRAMAGGLLVGLPVFRLTTQGVLSEPVFSAVALGLVAALLRYRRSGRGLWLACVLAAFIGVLRFVGAGLAILPAVERYRRDRSLAAAVGVLALCVAPAVLNTLWAGAVGGGHTAGWRGVGGEDVRVFSQSVAGWFDARYGDIRLTFFGSDTTPDWWVWVVTGLWLAAVVVAVVAYVTARPRLPEPLVLCLVSAGILTAGLAVGLAGFDALVIPDNRLMLPAGILTLCGLVWAFEVRGRWAFAGAAVLAVWALSAVRPWRWDERFSDNDRPGPHVEAAGAIDAELIVSNDADGVHWHTGKPAAYVPLATKALTGEPVDVAALYDDLPCALLEAGGAVVLAPSAFLGEDARPNLDPLVELGRLSREDLPGAVVYLPTAGCAG